MVFKERLALRRAPNSPTLLTFMGTSSLPLMKAWLYISQRSFSAESVGVSSFTGGAMIWLKSSQRRWMKQGVSGMLGKWAKRINSGFHG